MVGATFLSFSQASPQEKYINKISMVTLARSGVKTTECKLMQISFLILFFFPLAGSWCVVPFLSDFTERTQQEFSE